MKIRTLALAVLLALLLPQAQLAFAHSWGPWYDFRWKDDPTTVPRQDKNVQWRFVDNFPTGAARDSVLTGSNEWEDPQTSLNFIFQSTLPDWIGLQWQTSCNGYQEDKVGWASINGDGFVASEPLAQTWTCQFSSDPNDLWSFKIRFNDDAPWHTGSDTNVPIGRFDLQSLAVHEFGHATGRLADMTGQGGDSAGHFSDTGLYCDETDWPSHHTMCPQFDDGRYGWRQRETHDRDIFEGAY